MYPRVTASIAYFGCKAYIRRAVETLLNQSFREMRVIVVSDGDPEPPSGQLADIKDPRLVFYDLEKNFGPYFANAVS